eukprot:jgi/Phyca11/130293/e_gw1.92.118.1
MPGLSAKQLPPEVLRAGDLIEYYSRRFVVGDPRGHRRQAGHTVSGQAGH